MISSATKFLETYLFCGMLSLVFFKSGENTKALRQDPDPDSCRVLSEYQLCSPLI